jgi:hypothetical protein
MNRYNHTAERVAENAGHLQWEIRNIAALLRHLQGRLNQIIAARGVGDETDRVLALMMAQHARLGEESPLRHLDPLTVRTMIIEGIHAIHTPGVIALMTPDELRIDVREAMRVIDLEPVAIWQIE